MNVAAAVLVRNRQVLACQRRAGDRHGGKWEFPGGKLEAGESLAECLRRELTEELAIDAVVGPQLWCSRHQYPGRAPVVVTFFVVREFNGALTNRIFAALRWLPPAALTGLDFLEADRELVSALASGRVGLT